jgi:hypothetical protein
VRSGDRLERGEPIFNEKDGESGMGVGLIATAVFHPHRVPTGVLQADSGKHGKRTVENIEKPDYSQAYDEGSIHFTRSGFSDLDKGVSSSWLFSGTEYGRELSPGAFSSWRQTMSGAAFLPPELRILKELGNRRRFQ